MKFHGKTRLLKAASIFSAAAMLLCMLAGCTPNIKAVEPTEEESAVIGTIGKTDVLYEELRYLVLNYRAELEDKYGEGIWDSPSSAAEHLDELTSLVTENICSDYYAVIAMADDYYVGGAEAMFAEEEIQEAVRTSVNENAEECGGKKKYLAALAENNLTDHLFRFYLTAENCATELLYVLKNDLGEIVSDTEGITELMHSDSFLRTNHVYLKGLTEENAALAEKIRQQLVESNDRENEIILLKGMYCSDYNLTTTHGLYFARYTSDYGDEYEEAAFALKKGEVSGVVTAEEGYYVILRLEPEEDYLQKNFDDYSEDLIGSQFNIILAEYAEKLVFEFSDYGKSLNLLDIK